MGDIAGLKDKEGRYPANFTKSKILLYLSDCYDEEKSQYEIREHIKNKLNLNSSYNIDEHLRALEKEGIVDTYQEKRGVEKYWKLKNDLESFRKLSKYLLTENDGIQFLNSIYARSILINDNIQIIKKRFKDIIFKNKQYSRINSSTENPIFDYINDKYLTIALFGKKDNVLNENPIILYYFLNPEKYTDLIIKITKLTDEFSSIFEREELTEEDFQNAYYSKNKKDE
ncbi:MAG: helix-turn-helix transcriptional regulator [Candidatus Lokiarchaeota archaeon]|nr:helix-turn-helix transcriptional regulator [Candidatus Lokiarchaeota archaeon]